MSGAAIRELVSRSRARGLRVTPQRLAVYRVLAESHDHPDPDTLHRRLMPAHPTLSPATVYKTLDALAALGLVRRVPMGGGTGRYDANLQRHHHLVCAHCQGVTDVYDPHLDRLAPPDGRQGFRVREVSVQWVGICASCAKKNKSRSGQSGSLVKTANRR